MEAFLLKSKPYQIFLSLLLPTVLVSIIPNFDPNVPLIKKVIITLPYVFWIFMLGRTLNELILPRKRLSETMLIVNLFVFVGAFTLITMFSDVGINFYGLMVFIPLMLPISILYLYYFTAKALYTVENGHSGSFGDRLSNMGLLLLGIFGIWSIQPRLNKIWEQNKDYFLDDEVDGPMPNNSCYEKH